MGAKEHMDWLCSGWYEAGDPSVEYHFPPKSPDDTDNLYDKYTSEYRGLTALEAQCVVELIYNGCKTRLIWFDVRIPEGMETIARCYSNKCGYAFGTNGNFTEKIVRTPSPLHLDMLVRIPPYKTQQDEKAQNNA